MRSEKIRSRVVRTSRPRSKRRRRRSEESRDGVRSGQCATSGRRLVQKPQGNILFFPGNGRDLRVTSLTRIPKFGISLTVNNRWRRCANGSGLDRDSRLFQPRETIGQKRKIRAICSAFSNAGLSKAKQSDVPTQHNTHTRTPSNARVVTSMASSDDDVTRPPEEGLTVSASIGPRFGNAGVWREAVANSYYAARADEDEISLRVAEADREAREFGEVEENNARRRDGPSRNASRRATARIPEARRPRRLRRWTPKGAGKKAEIMRLLEVGRGEQDAARANLAPAPVRRRVSRGDEEDGRVLEHGGVYADTALWRRHEAEWREFMETARGMSIIRKRQIPSPRRAARRCTVTSS